MGQLPPYLIRHCSHAKNAPARDLASLAGEPSLFADSAAAKLERLRAGLAPLAGRYDAVVANPPYMGAKNMNAWLGGWVKKRYPDVKGDLFSCFMVRNSRMGAEHAQLGFMTPYVWMFIGTYEKLRRFVVEENTITSLIQLEYSGFSGATVPICTFTLQKGCCPGYRGGYVRLSDFVGADQQEPRALQALADPNCGWFYRANTKDFEAISGSPIAYWASSAMRDTFAKSFALGRFAFPRQGSATGNNDYFMRYHWEIACSKRRLDSRSIQEAHASGGKWFPYDKGGSYRKWYGNNDYVLAFDRANFNLLLQMGNHLPSRQFYFQPGITWSALSSGPISVRRTGPGHLFDAKGSKCFFESNEQSFYTMALLNSSTSQELLTIISPTLDYSAGSIAKFPFVSSFDYLRKINSLAEECCDFSRIDWDMLETSWGFKRNPLIG